MVFIFNFADLSKLVSVDFSDSQRNCPNPKQLDWSKVMLWIVIEIIELRTSCVASLKLLADVGVDARGYNSASDYSGAPSQAVDGRIMIPM